MDSLTVSLRPLELGDSGESNVFGRGKYAEFSELSLKIYEMKILHIFRVQKRSIRINRPILTVLN